MMDVWQTEWAKQCLIEANKFWFYALVFSLLWGIVQLFTLNQQPDEAATLREEKTESSSDEAITRLMNAEAKLRHKKAAIKRRLVVDGLDLLIPGHVVGWIVTSAATTGIAGAISTTLSMRDIWIKLS